MSANQSPTASLTRDFLTWLAEEPRSYQETMEAWRTSCPRLTVWEDALAEGLVRVQSGVGLNDLRVLLTERGLRVLET